MPAKRLQEQGDKAHDTRFRKGASGNPKGRASGSRNRATLLAERIMEAGAKDITDTVVAKACEGDMTAARIVLDRIAPPRRGRPVIFSLPKIESADDIIRAIGSIATAMAKGDLTPEEAAAVANVTDLKRRAIETDAHERRLEWIEQQLQKKEHPDGE